MRRSWITSGVVFGALVAAMLPASARPRADAGPRPVLTNGATLRASTSQNKIPGELVVGYRRGVTRSEAAEVRAAANAELVERASPHLEVVAVDGPLRAAADAIASDPDVAFVEPNFIYRAASLPNDPHFSSQWALHNSGQSIAGSAGTTDADIDASEAWDVTTGSDGVIVAVVDTGAAVNHPDLAPNIWTNPGESGGGKESNGVDDDGNGYVDDSQGWDFVGDDNRPTDLVGHGTHVAGIIGAQGGDTLGVTGVNWNVSIMVLKVLGDDGAGSTADVAAAIDYARANGALVVNASLGGPDVSAAVTRAVLDAGDTLFVAAAGNEAKNNDVAPSYPCNTPAANVLCVAASDQDDNLAGFSNYGAASVDLAAPGTRILNAQPSFARLMRETFEADISSSWVTGGTGARWSRALDSFGYYITDSAAGDYGANTDSWIATTEPVDLVGHENCQLSFVLRLAMETNQDLLHVEVSHDGTAWAEVESFTGGTNSTWVSVTEDLSDHDGDSVYVRFRTTSNALFEDDGASIDDVTVRCLTGTYAGSEYAYYSGSSMATPHVAGAAALLGAAAPDEGVSGLRSALLGGVDVHPSMVGKIQSGGRLNVMKALALAAPDLLPQASPSPSQSGEPTPTPTASSSPTPEASPSEPVDPPIVVEHGRQVSLRLERHVRAEGQVVAADGFAACMADVEVKIKRNGKLIKTTRTDARGGFSVKLRDRAGRYRARVARLETQTMFCGAAVSPLRRHRHR